MSQIRISRMSFLRINSWGIVTNKIIDSHSPSSRSLFILQFEDFIRARIVADAFATSGPSFGPRYWSMKSNSIPTPNEILFCVTTASGRMFILIFMGTSGRADWLTSAGLLSRAPLFVGGARPMKLRKLKNSCRTVWRNKTFRCRYMLYWLITNIKGP